MEPLIKWPGGKAGEIPYIQGMIPDFDRYVEPFFGGGALFFHLRPRRAVISDVSEDLIAFYRLVQVQDPAFHRALDAYRLLWEALLDACRRESGPLLSLYAALRDGALSAEALEAGLDPLAAGMTEAACRGSGGLCVPDRARFRRRLVRAAADKMRRTARNEAGQPFSGPDLRENLITGFMSGAYLCFRDVYNDIRAGRLPGVAPAQAAANFYFIREYCYGSMFRYNRRGEFNIPYGGMSYNRKDLGAKVDRIFSPETGNLFRGADIRCMDFEALLDSLDLTERDFLFLDPPYDTSFSDYEGRSFTRDDQRRLAAALERTRARFILVIQNTGFIRSLYESGFTVLRFDRTYAYNMRGRNSRSVEHLIVTNLPR